MLTTRLIVAFNYPYLSGGANRGLFQISRSKPSCLLPTSRLIRPKCQFLGHEILPIFSSTPELHHAIIAKIETAVRSSGVDPIPLPPSDGSPGSWKVWIVGMLISIILPFSRNKWWPLLQLKDKVENIMETAEQVTEVVEKVAEEVEKLAEEAADLLPEGGKLKEAALFIENVAKETEKEAHLAEGVIDKVGELEKEAESVIGQAMEIKEAKSSTEAKDIATKEDARN